MPQTLNGRDSHHDIDPVFLHRWSPRAFTGEAMPDAVLMSLFEAARWAPSGGNVQPWRFVYAKRDTPPWAGLLDALAPGNQVWVVNASVLMFIASERTAHLPNGETRANASHSFDAGAAWAYLALQAHHMGWAAHGMGGFDRPKAYAATGVPEADFQIEAAIAVGRLGDRSLLPEPIRARETPSGRKPSLEFIFEGRFSPESALPR